MSPGRGSRGRTSAGLLLFRRNGQELEVLLVHPGGPFWTKRDLGAWSIPKGECERRRGPARGGVARVRRGAQGHRRPRATCRSSSARSENQEGGQDRARVGHRRADLDPEAITSNTFTMEWPLRSGRSQEFPEVDRAGWFALAEARERINPAQVALLDRLSEAVGP